MKLTAKARRATQDLAPGPIVILSRPQLGENVGLVARAMLNFGLLELRLVAPRFGWPNAKAVAACAGAYEVLNRLAIFDTLDAAIADLHLLLATTARPRDLDKPVLDPQTAAARAAAAMAAHSRVGLLFGPERTGLTNEEIALADAVVTIPTHPAFASLNVAQAVLILAYEWFHSAKPEGREPAATAFERPASKGELRCFLDHLLRELDAAGFFRSTTSRESLVRAIELLFTRRLPTSAELNLLHGIVERLAHARRSARDPGSGSEEGGDSRPV
ncbi:tRNA (cytidine/uridine-2'-O-)-methyltransferase TrmJ [bacterium HR40]|nr:tRNA (cytidine/uridine-2'-O-)-methyltransferase TrmJ [bacterium HR40]